MKNTGERGFTIISWVFALAITAIILPAMAMSINTLINSKQSAVGHNIVLQRVENVGYWISKDIQMAESVSLTEPDGFPITLGIPEDATEGIDYSIEYVFVGNTLKRQVYDLSHTLTGETTVAENIDIDDTTFHQGTDTNNYELTVSVSQGEVVVVQSYQVTQRLSSS